MKTKWLKLVKKLFTFLRECSDFKVAVSQRADTRPACSPKALKEMTTLIIFLCIYGWLTKVRKEITLCSRKCSLVPRVREPGNEVAGDGVIISSCKASTATFVILRQGKKLLAVPRSTKRKKSRFLLYSIPNYTVFNENP